MTIEAYTNPDFGWSQKLIFLLAALAGTIICIMFIIGGVKISTSSMRLKKRERRNEFYTRSLNRVQRFYEMIIAGTSVMSFSCAYVIIHHIHTLITTGERTTDSVILMSMVSIWDTGRDFILLLLICLSCVLNSVLDKLIIPLKKTDRDEKACVRMLAMFYVIFILMYLNYIGDESEYNPVMIYYLGLMVGRFIYFDASFKDFLHAMKNLWQNLYLLILGLTLTGILCYFGFSQGYLLERNYYIVGAFYTHLFMLVTVFILHHSRILLLFIRKPKGYVDPAEAASAEALSGAGAASAQYYEEAEDYDSDSRDYYQGDRDTDDDEYYDDEDYDEDYDQGDDYYDPDDTEYDD
ncbi:MAG: hypothetical protein K6F54_08165 [Lachnospiraceae bacterium]|nr:hypothetical protein [Lachnospiraceae bacterium]